MSQRKLCPCCGGFSFVNIPSGTRNGVLVCTECAFKGLDSKPHWYVDDLGSTRILDNNYEFASEYSDFGYSKIQTWKHKVKGYRFIVLSKQFEGYNVLYETNDLNLAQAFALGYVGRGSKQVSNFAWVAKTGDIVTIEQV